MSLTLLINLLLKFNNLRYNLHPSQQTIIILLYHLTSDFTFTTNYIYKVA